MLLLLLLSACPWRSYEEILEIHLEVLTQTADKLRDVSAARQWPGSQGIAEYVYPAKRARQFLHQFAKHRERPSYKGLSAFLDQYEDMIHRVDSVRPGAEIDGAELQRDVAALHAVATTIRAELAAGR